MNYGLLGFARDRVQGHVSVRLRSLSWLPRQGGCLFGGSIIGISVNLDARLVLIYVILYVEWVRLCSSIRCVGGIALSARDKERLKPQFTDAELL